MKEHINKLWSIKYAEKIMVKAQMSKILAWENGTEWKNFKIVNSDIKED